MNPGAGLERPEADSDAAGEPEREGSAERRSKHPLAVVLPIGAWGASLAFDMLSHYGPPGNGFARLSRTAMLAGVAGATLAGAFGLRDLLRFSPEHRPGALGLFHAGLNAAAVAFYGAAMLRRGALVDEGNSDKQDDPAAQSDGRVSFGEAASNAAMLGVLGVSGTVGGLLARRFDVRPG